MIGENKRKLFYCNSLPLREDRNRARFHAAFVAFLFMYVTCVSYAQASLPIAQDEQSAVILAYQKIDEDQYPETSLSADKFEAHMEELLNGGYTILGLDDVLRHFESSAPESLPPMPIVITFDGPYRSAYKKAFPILIKHRIPFTIFVAPQLMDSTRPTTLRWEELRELTKKHDFITIGLHPYFYTRLHTKSPSTIKEELKKAEAILELEIGDSMINGYGEADIDDGERRNARQYNGKKTTPRLNNNPKPVQGNRGLIFAYPFGAYSAHYVEAVKDSGFKAAVTLSSGVAYKGMNRFEIPRFAMTDRYGRIERFRTVVNAAPLPVEGWVLPSIKDMSGMNKISFEVSPDIMSLDLLRCFVSGQGKPKMSVASKRVDNEEGITAPNDRFQYGFKHKNIVTLKLAEPLRSGRTRVNCTMPGPANEDLLGVQRYRWFGMLYSLE